jgi:hypothetical protein
MAKPKTDTNGNGNGETMSDNGDSTGQPSRFRKISTEAYMFNAEKCYATLPAKDRLPLVGYLLGMKAMPPIKGRDWDALIIQTTEPTHALDREKNIIRVEPGTTVLIPATFEIKSQFARAALNVNSVFEVSISPKKKIDIGGGQTMWTFDLAANPKALNRKAFGVSALLESGISNLPQLTAANDESDDIPAPF